MRSSRSEARVHLLRPPELLVGGGESGALIRAHDWARTPLGPLHQWPQGLLTAVGLILESPFGMCIAWGAERVQLYNDAWRAVLGTKHPAIGKPVAQTFSKIWSTIGPLFERVGSGEALRCDDLPLSLERNGDVEECFFACSASPVRDEAGRVAGALLTLSDTTGRVLAERRLRTLGDLAGLGAGAFTPADVLRAAARVLGENAADAPCAACYAWDADVKRATLVASTGLADAHPAFPLAVESAGSAQALLLAHAATIADFVAVDRPAWTSIELKAGPWPEPIARLVVAPLIAGTTTTGFLVAGLSPRCAFDDAYADFLRRVAATVGSAMATARTLEVERIRARSDLAHAETKLAGMLERERMARAEAEAANRSKDDFIAVLSHELRSPLNAILGWARLLNTTETDAAARRRGIDTIERNAHLQGQLIDDLLDISRIVAGKLVLETAPVDLARIAREAVHSVAAGADAKGVRIECVGAEAEATIAGDAARLQQVVCNLVTNAVKFTPAGGSVTVAVGITSDTAEVVVSDTGRGIDAALLPHVFERFRQADESSARDSAGLGLGLAIVQHIVERHGGTVTATSEGLDRGATFTVTLPRASSSLEPASPASPHAEPLPSPATLLAGVRVLVVEDDADSRDMIVRALSACSAGVTAAASASEALAAIQREWPHVLVSDISMPGTDGYHLIRKIRRLAVNRRPRLSAIALTAHARPEDRLRTLFSGFDVHMPKPVDPMELASIVARLAGVA
jgi:signal transduction histidine kinase